MNLHQGDRLDHYQIGSLVARSGMASIFRATDTRNGQPVAIKFPHEEMESDLVLHERFVREYETGKRLDHPGVMKVYEVPVRGRFYAVMEWVEGRTLRKIIAEKAVPQEVAIAIVFGILQALDYMHDQGVTHRDLKPENIMVDDEGRIKVIDFGIASLAGRHRESWSASNARSWGRHRQNWWSYCLDRRPRFSPLHCNPKPGCCCGRGRP